jgi:hypothetical protein
MLELRTKYTIAIVTHNLHQAKRVADRTASRGYVGGAAPATWWSSFDGADLQRTIHTQSYIRASSANRRERSRASRSEGLRA